MLTNYKNHNSKFPYDLTCFIRLKNKKIGHIGKLIEKVSFGGTYFTYKKMWMEVTEEKDNEFELSYWDWGNVKAPLVIHWKKETGLTGSKAQLKINHYLIAGNK